MSEKALQQEAELEQQIDLKVEGDFLLLATPTSKHTKLKDISFITVLFWFVPFAEIIQMMKSRDEDPDLLYVIKFLAAEDIPGLPPGGGITSK